MKGASPAAAAAGRCRCRCATHQLGTKKVERMILDTRPSRTDVEGNLVDLEDADRREDGDNTSSWLFFCCLVFLPFILFTFVVGRFCFYLSPPPPLE
jgi:hypothetical protein